MAIPATVGMFVNALYNVVDTIFVGRGVGSLAIAGLTVAFPLQLIMVAIGLAFGIGGASVISRSLGSGDRERARHAAGTAFTLAVLSAGVLSIVGLTFLEPILRVFGATDEIIGFSREYLTTILPGSVFVSGAIAANHIVRSEGQALHSMLIMVIGAGLNIVLDAIFILGFGMGIQGAALATVIAQSVSFTYAILFYLRGKSALKLGFRDLLPRPELAREVVKLGLPPFIRQFAGSFFIIITNSALVAYGSELHVSAFGVIYRVLIFSLMPLFGIAQGFQPIAGYNYGAGQFSRVRAAVRATNLTTITISSFFFVLVMIFPRSVFSLFTTDEALIAIGIEAIRIMMLAVPMIGLQIAGAVFFQAVGKAVPAMFLSLSRQVLLLIPFILIFPPLFGLTGIWFAFPAADIISTVMTLIWLSREMRRLPTDRVAGSRETPEPALVPAD
jgi:putative MATE family efflux protein